MLIHDDIFTWEGWGGRMRLASGCCRLRIFDLQDKEDERLRHLRPMIVVVSDVPESRMSVKSCAGHIASKVAQSFAIEHSRMLFIEYYPGSIYGEKGQHRIPERFELVEFDWHAGKAVEPRWRDLKPPMGDIVGELIRGS